MPKRLVHLILCLSLILYVIIGYFTVRSNFTLLLSVYSSLFIGYYYLLKDAEKISADLALAAGLFFRFILIFSIPALSDDVYRFLWDGRIQQLGINPFDFTPRELLDRTSDPILKKLFPSLNSPDYYTVYPQLLQYIFWLAGKLGGESLLGGVVVLKSIVFAFEAGSVYLLKNLLSGKQKKLFFIYLFNPLVIIELTGNIHFEAAMIFFILLAAYLLRENKLKLSALPLTLAIQAKLLPLMAIPLFIRKIGVKNTVFYGSACILLFYLFSPLLWISTERWLHFFSSLQLYYGKFEFNGGVYSVFRTAGWAIVGYNPIQWVSKIMLACSLICFMWIYNRKMEFLPGFFWLTTAYLVFSAIVHPWYLAALIAFSPFVKYRFALIWSALIPLTYSTYFHRPYQQNYWLISIEYLLVLAFLVYEVKFKSKRNKRNIIEPLSVEGSNLNYSSKHTANS